MITTSLGYKECRPISAEMVKEQILGLVFDVHSAGTFSALQQLLKTIDELPTVSTPDGKKLRKAYYPRVMVVDNGSASKKPMQVGGNSHHRLEVRHGKNASCLSFLNIQCGVGTDFADEGYTFVGEKPFEAFGDDAEIVPFDEVWVEEM